ncbi:MAG TPA: ABC transporter permease, partial [Cyclobacteriaceae bacterium]|nr:ABC transporter permease [Cyclobacteriaceae bacterium]
MKNNPPGFFLNFFRWFCHPKILDYIEGDLIEVYRVRLKKHGKRNADLRFMIDVLLLFRPGIIRPAEGHKSLTNYGMIKSYFKIGWRNLLRNKGYSFINIGGLAIGMMVAILNGLWIWHEFSYNKNFANYDRIAKVAETGIDIERGNRYVGTTMTYPLSTELSEKYRQHFREVVRASFNGDQILSSGETMISANGVYVGETAPDVFTFKMLQGTRKGLANMNSILISESLAESLFGTIDVLNRASRMNNKTDVVVTGVYEDFPDNSEFNNVR